MLILSKWQRYIQGMASFAICLGAISLPSCRPANSTSDQPFYVRTMEHLNSIPIVYSWIILEPADDIRFTDADVSNVLRRRQFTSLDLSRAPELTDRALDQIGNQSNLEYLNASHIALGTNTLESFSKLPYLRRLTLEGCGFTDMHLSALRKCSGIAVLKIGANEITDDGVAQLASLSQLSQLWLNSCKRIRGSSLHELTSRTRIHTLVLNDTLVNTDIVRMLAESGIVKNLAILNTPNVDIKTVDQLRKLHPEITIQADETAR